MKTGWLFLAGFGLSLNLITAFAPPLDNWHWRNPLPDGNPPSGPHALYGLVFASGKFVGVGDSGIASSSTDSTNWTESATATTNQLNGINYASGQFVAVGNGGAVETSPDGLNWTLRNSGTTNPLNELAYSNGKYVAVGTSNVLASADAENWSPAVSGLSGATGVTGGNNGFVAINGSNQAFFSIGGSTWTSSALTVPDTGTIWTSRASGTSLPIFSVAYANGLYVAVGQLGTALTSPDGINWTGQDSGQLTNLLSVTFGSAGFLAVGPGGTALTSPDGVNWTQQNPGATASFESATFGDGYYLVVGDNAVALTSPDGVNWTSRNVGASGGQNLYGSAFLNNRFDIVGSGGTVIESDVIAPLFDLQMHRGISQNAFSVFITPGSSFRIQACTNLVFSGWTDVATFNNASAITLWTNTTAGFNQRFFRAISP
jgi:hypothetical protein